MIPILRHTAGCQFFKIAPAGFRILAALDDATITLNQDLTITAGTNDHSSGRHATGEAYDVRTKDLTVEQTVKLWLFLRVRLGDRFTVLYETPTLPSDPKLLRIATLNPKASGAHIHCQPVKDTEYPPED